MGGVCVYGLKANKTEDFKGANLSIDAKLPQKTNEI